MIHIKSSKVLTLIFAIFAIFSQVAAKEYTLDDLISIGQQNAWQIQKNLISDENSQSQVRSSYLNLLPKAEAYYNVTNTDGNAPQSAGITVSKSISLNEPTYFSLKQSILNRKISSLSLDLFKKQLSYEIYTQYLDILQQQHQMKIQQDNFTLQKTLYSQTKLQYDLKQKTIFELQQAEIDTFDNVITISELNNNIQKARDNLFLLINSKDEGFDFAEISLPISEGLPEYHQSLDIEKLNLDINSEKLSVLQNKLSLYPNVSLGWQFNHSKTGRDLGEITDFSNYDNSNTLSLNISYSFLSYWQDGETYKRVKHDYVSKLLDLHEQETKEVITYNQYKRDWLTYRQNYEIYMKKRDLAESNLRMAEEKYQLGIVSLQDMDRTRIDYLQSQLKVNDQYFTLLKTQENINLLLSNKINGKW